MSIGKGYYNEIAILKVAATFFITWFHFQGEVPNSYRFLFIGGVIGNSLFFFCSGYLVKIKSEYFHGEWMVKKLIRLLPSVWVFLLISRLCRITSLHWYNFIYPTPYWFVNAIIGLFILYYIFHSLIAKYKYAVFVFVILIHSLLYFIYMPHDYLIVDGSGSMENWFFYFLFFLQGYYSRNNNNNLNDRKSLKWNVLGVIFFIGAFYSYKTLCKYYTDWIFYQFLVMPILLLGMLYCFHKAAIIFVKRPLNKKLKKVLIEISNLTLDIYIVQLLLIHRLMPEILFPMNIFVLLSIILIAAYINNRIAGKISSLLLSLFPKK
jgi:surface polysaccharide O-acyltransferase-like enzyme